MSFPGPNPYRVLGESEDPDEGAVFYSLHRLSHRAERAAVRVCRKTHRDAWVMDRGVDKAIFRVQYIGGGGVSAHRIGIKA